MTGGPADVSERNDETDPLEKGSSNPYMDFTWWAMEILSITFGVAGSSLLFILVIWGLAWTVLEMVAYNLVAALIACVIILLGVGYIGKRTAIKIFHPEKKENQ